MSAPSTGSRLAFYGMTEERRAAAIVEPGPSRFHRLHGAIPIRSGVELRITTQSALHKMDGHVESGRIVIRRWYERPAATWWPDNTRPGVVISAEDAETFGRAVAAAVEALTSGAKR
jgi:hypothetical protein